MCRQSAVCSSSWCVSQYNNVREWITTLSSNHDSMLEIRSKHDIQSFFEWYYAKCRRLWYGAGYAKQRTHRINSVQWKIVINVDYHQTFIDIPTYLSIKRAPGYDSNIIHAALSISAGTRPSLETAKYILILRYDDVERGIARSPSQVQGPL